MRKVTAKEFNERQQKVAHVKSAEFVKGHTCHWPGCKREVKPAFWGCWAHWRQLPHAFKERIWATYQVGQEDRKDPNIEYIAVAREIQYWITTNAK